MDFPNKEHIKIFDYQQEDTSYHSHDFLELVYITEGRTMHWLDGEGTQVKEGDYFIIDYRSEHMYRNFDDEGCKLINCLFKPYFIDPILKNCRSFRELLYAYQIRLGTMALRSSPTGHVFCDKDGEVRILIEKMKREYNMRNAGWAEIVRCRLIETLIITVRGIMAGNSSKNFDVARAAEIAERSFTQKIGIAEAAAECGITPQYLSTKFKAETGMTFTEYTQRLRIGMGCRLLSETDKKVSEISEMCGYADVKFFNALFKRMLGITPGEFRKLNERRAYAAVLGAE